VAVEEEVVAALRPPEAMPESSLLRKPVLRQMLKPVLKPEAP